MIRNGKYFLPPPEEGLDLKELLQFAVSAGLGLPVDNNGNPIGAWTTELLAEEMSLVHPTGKGADPRTIRNWLQDNDRGIGPDYVDGLARVFGCGDPDGIGTWRREISGSNRRFAALRRAKKTVSQIPNAVQPDTVEDEHEADENEAVAFNRDQQEGASVPRKKFSLSEYVNDLFVNRGGMNLQVGLWSYYLALGLLHVGFGIHNVTYSPMPGLDKQVGLFWAPNWTILPAFILPMFIYSMSNTLSFWQLHGRDAMIKLNPNLAPSLDWTDKLRTFWLPFWVVTLVCVLFVFGFQWYGLYGRMHIAGDPAGFQIDRNLLALVRPEVVTPVQSLTISMFSFIYIAWHIGVLLFGLLLSYALIDDFRDLFRRRPTSNVLDDHRQTREIAQGLIGGVFRSIILGLWIATLVKLQVAYLLSDGENILAWLANDFGTALGFSQQSWDWLNQHSMGNFTTFVLAFVHCFIFIFGVIITRAVLQASVERHQAASSLAEVATMRSLNTQHLLMIVIILLLAANVLLTGQFLGFSILLSICALISGYCLYDPSLTKMWSRL